MPDTKKKKNRSHKPKWWRKEAISGREQNHIAMSGRSDKVDRTQMTKSYNMATER